MDSKALFAQQVRLHAQTIGELLARTAGNVAGSDAFSRCNVATRMLTGTTSLMGMPMWEDLLGAYHGLLSAYAQHERPCDGPFTQLSTRLIEAEEALVAAHDAGTPDIEIAVGADEIAALSSEVRALAATSDSWATSETTPSPAPAAAVAPIGNTDAPFGNVAAHIVATTERLDACFRSDDWSSRRWNADTIGTLRGDLAKLTYYADAVAGAVAGEPAASDAANCDIEPLQTVLRDYVREVARVSDRDLVVRFEGNATFDPGMLERTSTILQSMISDIASRCENRRIEIALTCSQRDGSVHWCVSDNGGNFISDSQVDHEDQLAFYPRLKTVTRILNECEGVLWVEPAGERRSRFEFLVPVSVSPLSLIVWGEGESAFAVRASQVCDRVEADATERGEDTYGAFVHHDNRRVPLVQLDELYTGAPQGGSKVAILGSVEKRVAVYTPGAGSVRQGRLLRETISPWPGSRLEAAGIDGTSVPIVDAARVLAGYLSATGTLGSQESSGGATGEELEISNRQATMASNQTASPDIAAAVETQLREAEEAAGEAIAAPVEVLVLEQSETTRDALTRILVGRQLTAACADDVEEAIGIIESRAPRLIISEFRMPTMAAKHLVDKLRDSGKAIPVLVTTSQTGKTADMLVEKLGVSGYLSKPLIAEEVSVQLSCYLDPTVA